MSAVLNCNISFIGGGNMAQALIGGLVARGLAPNRITVSDPVEGVRELLAKKGCKSPPIMQQQFLMLMWWSWQLNHKYWPKC